MRIAFYGVGGAAGYFGAQLGRAGENVIFLARGKHLQAIRKNGLRVIADSGEINVYPALATDDPGEVGAVDIVIVGVKAEQVVDAACAIRPMIGPDTAVVPLQNGVEAHSQLAEVLGRKHVLGGLCGTLSWVTGPGQIRSIGDAHFVKFGELDNRSSERAEALHKAFDGAGVTAQIPGNIHQALWEKFLFVVSFGGVGAVTRSPIGVVRTVSETRRMLEQCMNEILSIAQAREIPMTDAIIESTLAFVDSLPADGTTSLQRDIVDRKPSELEAWNGAVVRLGREAGVPTPLHEFIYHSLLPQELKVRDQARKNN